MKAINTAKTFVAGAVCVLLLQAFAMVATFVTRDVSFNNEANAFSLTVLAPVEEEMAMLAKR